MLDSEFKEVVAGFVNGVHVVGRFGDREKVRKATLTIYLCSTVPHNLRISQLAKNISLGQFCGCHLDTLFFQVTSLSLRSLCKTVLSDTNPETNSASARSRVLVDILSSLAGPGKQQEEFLNCARVAECAVTVQDEEAELDTLKGMLSTQVRRRRAGSGGGGGVKSSCDRHKLTKCLNT